MNRSYVGRCPNCFYQFYARLAQIITRFLQNESQVSTLAPPWERDRERGGFRYSDLEFERFVFLCFVYYYVVCYNLDELKKTIL